MAAFLKGNKLVRLSTAHVLRRFSSTSPGKNGLILGVYCEENKQGIQFTCATEKYNKVTNGRLCEALKFVDNTVKEGKSHVFWGLNCEYPAVAVVGLGKKCKGVDEIEHIDKDKEAVRVAAAAGCKALQEIGVKRICVDDLGDPQAAAEGCTLGLWCFQELKSKQECSPEINLFCGSDCDYQLWNLGVSKANAQNLARQLNDMPSNLMTPTIFANRVEELFSGLDVCVEIHDEQWAKNKSMNAFLAVAQGSCEPPKFVELSYTKGCQEDGPYVLVGKGVTFDSGGISIKPSGGMKDMRGDKGGAVVCIAALQALATLGVPANIKVLIPLAENMPSGKAVKPGDIVKAMNGKSICVDNTDAEGRLLLADALAYSGCFKPKWVMDIATLTGAIKVALGNAAAGVFTNSNSLYTCLQNCSSKTGDRVWRMPLWEHYVKDMKSHSGFDLNNISTGTKGGGSCTAAAFLKEFVPKGVNWLHVDIAGIMGPDTDCSYLGKGMTGRPTRTIIEFIQTQSKIIHKN